MVHRWGLWGEEGLMRQEEGEGEVAGWASWVQSQGRGGRPGERRRGRGRTDSKARFYCAVFFFLNEMP